MTEPTGNAVSVAMPAASTAITGMGHHFSVLLDNAAYDLGTWHKASGLSVSWEPVTYRVGDSNEMWILPGNPKYQNIELSRAACAESNIVQAWLATTSRYPIPQSGTIMLVNWLGIPIIGWRLTEFYPIGWKVSEFSAHTGHVALETLTLAHTGFLLDEISFPGK
ncbi:MAG TPA: phage tail protein [Streptosporangiaceae bacterium]|nr:phage tail protein [Streptosporangiaceae bacterium]